MSSERHMLLIVHLDPWGSLRTAHRPSKIQRKLIAEQRSSYGIGNIQTEDLNSIGNFINKFSKSMSPTEIQNNIKIFIKSAKNQITNTSKKLLLKGIKIEKSQNTETFFVRGLPNLIKNNLETDLDSINELLSDIETGKMANKMIKALKKSKGVQIFIGSNTNFFKNTNLSMILSNYKTKNGLTGAIGVIGPKRIDYQRIVPIVSYMSETISKK